MSTELIEIQSSSKDPKSFYLKDLTLKANFSCDLMGVKDTKTLSFHLELDLEPVLAEPSG